MDGCVQLGIEGLKHIADGQLQGIDSNCGTVFGKKDKTADSHQACETGDVHVQVDRRVVDLKVDIVAEMIDVEAVCALTRCVVQEATHVILVLVFHVGVVDRMHSWRAMSSIYLKSKVRQ